MHAGRLLHGIYVHARFDDLDLHARLQGVGKGKKNQRRLISITKQTISIKLGSTVGQFVCDLDFENVYMA